ncbi:MAG: GNAT family N-acetyltransferase [Leptolyngbyaceae cyanobacterium MO_188.B28]|nr:GNAT family N-acetyltransferase [Leptolyngbyaceae cyanobacterium MO_188.B28]
MEIRRYADSDASAVKVLHKIAMEDVGAFIPGPWDADMDAISETYLNGRGEFLVGCVDGVIVAMGAFRPVNDTTAEIKRLRVHPERQRQGFGRDVLERLELTAKQLGYSQLQLDTMENQVGAIQFFQKQGYRHFSTRTGKGRNQLLFAKTLSSAD